MVLVSNYVADSDRPRHAAALGALGFTVDGQTRPMVRGAQVGAPSGWMLHTEGTAGRKGP